MPEVGTRDLRTFERHGGPVEEAALREGTLTLTGAEMLHLAVEIDDRPLLELLPPALHPSLPALATFVFWRCADSEVGPFSLAQVRAGCRAGLRGRYLLCGAYCDGERAAAWLHDHRGIGTRPATIDLRRRYDRVEGTVEVEGRTILRVALATPEVIAAETIELADTLAPAWVHAGGETHLRLVQVEPEYQFDTADRGAAVVEQFDAAAWSAEQILPGMPVVALACRGEFRLPPVRYLLDPAAPPR